VIAGLVAPALSRLDQAYQFIQEYVGFISPGVLAIFLMGLFWKRTTATAALLSALLTIPLSALLKFLPAWTNGRFPDYPFLDRMSIVFVFLLVLMVAVSMSGKPVKAVKEVIIDPSQFRTSRSFVVGSVLVTGILAALYTVFW
jgi:SSS family solute:Na+ symporter